MCHLDIIFVYLNKITIVTIFLRLCFIFFEIQLVLSAVGSEDKEKKAFFKYVAIFY